MMAQGESGSTSSSGGVSGKACSQSANALTRGQASATAGAAATSSAVASSSNTTGNCTQHQRDVAMAVKNAREVALLPYSSTAR
jgi:hypothetical protein